MILLRVILLFVCLGVVHPGLAAENIIEKQLEEIGKIPNEEIIVVQRKYTKKDARSELTPINFGGMPFGTVRNTLFAGASYTRHFTDWLGWEALSFLYAKNFFTGFTSEVNTYKTNPNQPNIKPDFQKLLYFLTTGVQITPFYGKISTFSRWIAYIEPFIILGGGIAKTETNMYPTFFPGIGLRVFFKEWFSMRVEFRDYIYNESTIDRTAGTSTTKLRNNYSVMFSVSFWLPQLPK